MHHTPSHDEKAIVSLNPQHCTQNRTPELHPITAPPEASGARTAPPEA